MAVAVCECLAICACAKTNVAAAASAVSDMDSQWAETLLPGEPGVRKPVASGTQTYAENGVSIDCSHADLGYVMVKSTENAQKLKARVGAGGTLYNYDLPSDGQYHVFPLSQGDGDYVVRVLERVAGDRYSPICQMEFSVRLAEPYAPFLYPNEYVQFDETSQSVAKAEELTARLSAAQEKADVLYAFVAETVAYDHEKAATVQAGYVPNADETLISCKGICFDYAALVAVMLRAQGIPAKLVVGSVQPENLLHAWNSVWLGGRWKLYDATFAAQPRAESHYIEERVY